MIARGRVKRLETAWRPRRKVTPTYDFSEVTEAEARYMITLLEKDGALTPDEVRAAVAIEAKVVKT